MITNLQVNFDGKDTFKIEYDYHSDTSIPSGHKVEYKQFPNGIGDTTKFGLLYLHKLGHRHYWSDEESAMVIDKIWEIIKGY